MDLVRELNAVEIGVLVILGLGVFSRALARQIRMLEAGEGETGAYAAVDRRTIVTSCKSLTDLNMLDYREEFGAKALQRCGVQGHGRSLWQELRGRFLEASGAPLLSDDVERPRRLSGASCA